MSNDTKRCGGWEEPCDKLAKRIFEARGRGADGFGERGWHVVRLCEHRSRAFFQKNGEEGFVEVRFR